MNLQENELGGSLAMHLQHMGDVFELALFGREHQAVDHNEMNLNELADTNKLEDACCHLINVVEASIDELENSDVQSLLSELEQNAEMCLYFLHKFEIIQQQTAKTREQISKLRPDAIQTNKYSLRNIYVVKGILDDTYKSLMRLRLAVLTEQADKESAQASPVFSNPQDALNFLKNA